ncbi:MAG: hypothetical protein QOD27_914, partial [Microbacteriaceae bacterium]|nr:hypothetical protein [Microbacteriaceae bacterium]
SYGKPIATEPRFAKKLLASTAKSLQIS